MLDFKKIYNEQFKHLRAASNVINESVFWWAKQVGKTLEKIRIIENFEGTNSPKLFKLIEQLKNLVARSEFEDKNMELMQRKILKLKQLKKNIDESEQNKKEKK